MEMDVEKLSQRKTEEAGDLPAKAQKAKPVKKSGDQTAKPKKAEAAKKPPKKTEEAGPPWWQRFRQYLREVAYELKKVIWPSRKETIGSTAVVLVIVILTGIYLGIVDAMLSRFVRFLFG